MFTRARARKVSVTSLEKIFLLRKQSFAIRPAPNLLKRVHQVMDPRPLLRQTMTHYLSANRPPDILSL